MVHARVAFTNAFRFYKPLNTCNVQTVQTGQSTHAKKYALKLTLFSAHKNSTEPHEEPMKLAVRHRWPASVSSFHATVSVP